MKNWKKLLATGLSTALILGTLASCGGGNTSSPAASSGAATSGSGSDASSTTTTNFPDGKSLSMIIHASPGGLSDTNARFIAQMVSDELGVPFPATNMTGGSGVVAMTYVKESTPDGYTVGYLPCELAMVKAQGLTEIIEPSAFDMIYACNIQPAAITVSADSEWDSIEDLVAWCKEHPGELQVGTSGTGSVWHIAADAFAKAAGIEINLVPFDGAATAVTNLMGGHVQMVPVSESEVASGVASGKLKILAVCSSDRSEFNPDVPTLQELGYDVDVTAWGGFGVAKGTPDDVKEVLYAAFEKAVNSEEFKELASQGQYSPLIMDHEEFAEFAQSQYEFYTEYFTDTAQ